MRLGNKAPLPVDIAELVQEARDDRRIPGRARKSRKNPPGRGRRLALNALAEGAGSTQSFPSLRKCQLFG
jgi:hypothetical protein